MFPSNQVRHFYVVKEVVDSLKFDKTDNPGQAAIKKTQEGEVFLQVVNALGEIERTDLIYPNCATARKTTAEKLRQYLKKAEVELAEDPVVGQDYVLHIEIKSFVDIDERSTYRKFGAVHVTKDIDTKTKFAEAMVKSLKKNFGRDEALNKFFDFTADGEKIVITEVEQPWRLGVFEQVLVNFVVLPTNIIVNGEEVPWAKLDEETETIKVTNSDKYIKNGKKTADMEWFYHGERGDLYREVGYPNNLVTKYMVDPEEEYDIYDIHFAFVGANHSVQKSERDLTIAVPAGTTLTGLQDKLKESGVKLIGFE